MREGTQFHSNFMTRGRPSGEKTRCGGQWTEAKFRSFVKGNLRAATLKWAPIQICKKQALIRRGFYRCAGCHNEAPTTIVENGSRVRNNFVDHIKPTVDPAIGFTTWDDVIEGLFCEADNLQVLCKQCHDTKSEEERQVARERRAKEKEIRDIQVSGEQTTSDLEQDGDA